MSILPGGNAVFISESPVKARIIGKAAIAVDLSRPLPLGQQLPGDEQPFFLNIPVDAGAYKAVKFMAQVIFADKESDIYVDEEYKGKGTWKGRLTEGAHFVEAKKKSHETSSKNINLVLGKNETIDITNKNDIQETYTFVSNDESIATVSTTGLVTGVKVGNVKIVAIIPYIKNLFFSSLSLNA